MPTPNSKNVELLAPAGNFEKLEILSPRQAVRKSRIGDLRDDQGHPLQIARPGTRVYPDLGLKTNPNDLIRKLVQPRT